MPLFDKPVSFPVDSTYQDPREHRAEDVDKFLRKIAFLESSYGQNTDHSTMQSGPHIGTHAVGDYGLMPLTAQQIDKNSGNNQLQDLDKFDTQAKLEQDPALTNRLAATMASKLLSKNPSEEAAYKWNQGQYTNPDQDTLDNNDYVKKFRVLSNATK